MDLKEAQQLVDKWIKENGVRYFDELTNTVLLMEEMGEVARIIARRYGEQSFKKGEEDADLAEELADMLFVLICIANQTHIDLSSALIKSIEKKTNRDHSRHKENPKLNVKVKKERI